LHELKKCIVSEKKIVAPVNKDYTWNQWMSRAFSLWRKHMAQPAWKRPGSPIGKTGSRKTNPKYKRRLGEPWTLQEVKDLKSLARKNTPTGVLSLKLQRPPAAIRSKAQREGISLKPINRKPYTRRKRNTR
jgi:hypothetical protein